VDLRQLLRTLQRRWRFVAIVFGACVAVAAGLTSVITPMYSSTAQIYITPTGESLGNADPFNASLYAQQRITSYAALATDPSVLKKVIERAGSDLTTDQLAKQVSSVVTPGTFILPITVRDKNPGSAQDLANAMAEEIGDLVTQLETPPVTANNKSPVPALTAKTPGEASYNENPVSPNMPLNVIVGALLGLLIGVAGAVLRETFDNSVKTTKELAELTGAPVMAVIPYDSGVRKHPLMTSPEASPLRGEPYRVLRTNLQFVDLDAKRQMFVVSSAGPNEGKTVTAVNVALAMAQSGREVLLIDGDLRSPGVCDMLELDNSRGLMTAVLGTAGLDEVVQQQASGLAVLGTGPLPPNPTEVLDTEAVRTLLSQAHDEYDVVIIDSPALLPYADAAIVAGMVGGVLLVVKQGRTSRDDVLTSVDRLRAVGASISGVIPTMVPKITSFASEGPAEEQPAVTPASRAIRRSRNDGAHKPKT
jgi:capsular exopolysaccharide synthesis family protein